MLASLVLAIPLATPTTFQATPAAGRPAAPRAPTRVRVLDARHGLPLGGARLVWFDTADLDPRRAERAAERHSTRRLMWRTADEDAVTTGADGLAELPGPRGTLYVRAELHDASAWFSHAADDERPAEVALDVTPTVPVRLLDAEGAPIAGARAWWLAAGSAGGPLPAPAPDAAPSDGNGLARVGVHAPAGTERFRLVVDGLDLPPIEPLASLAELGAAGLRGAGARESEVRGADARGAGARPLERRLGPHGSLELVAVAADGRPPDLSAPVTIDGLRGATVTFDTDGRALVERVPLGREPAIETPLATVRANGPRAAGERITVRLELPPAQATLAFELLAPDGEPYASRYVEALLVGERGGEPLLVDVVDADPTQLLGRIEAGLASRIDLVRPRWRAVFVDAAGRARLRPASWSGGAPDRLELRLRGDAEPNGLLTFVAEGDVGTARALDPAALTPRAGEPATVELGRLRLGDDDRRIAGVVRSALGRPIEGARVALADDGAMGLRMVAALEIGVVDGVTTDADGRFALPVACTTALGRVELWVHLQDAESGALFPPRSARGEARTDGPEVVVELDDRAVLTLEVHAGAGLENAEGPERGGKVGLAFIDRLSGELERFPRAVPLHTPVEVHVGDMGWYTVLAFDPGDERVLGILEQVDLYDSEQASGLLRREAPPLVLDGEPARVRVPLASLPAEVERAALVARRADDRIRLRGSEHWWQGREPVRTLPLHALDASFAVTLEELRNLELELAGGGSYPWVVRASLQVGTVGPRRFPGRERVPVRIELAPDLPSEVLVDGGGLPDDLWLYDSLDWATRVRRASDGAWAGLVFPTRSAWLTDGEGTLEETLVRFVEGEAGGGNDGAADGPLRVVLDREALDDLHGRLPFERAALAPAASDRSPRAGDDRR